MRYVSSSMSSVSEIRCLRSPFALTPPEDFSVMLFLHWLREWLCVRREHRLLQLSRLFPGAAPFPPFRMRERFIAFSRSMDASMGSNRKCGSALCVQHRAAANVRYTLSPSTSYLLGSYQNYLCRQSHGCPVDLFLPLQP